MVPNLNQYDHRPAQTLVRLGGGNAGTLRLKIEEYTDGRRERVTMIGEIEQWNECRHLCGVCIFLGLPSTLITRMTDPRR